jgi:hypothetical protein
MIILGVVWVKDIFAWPIIHGGAGCEEIVDK